MEHIFVPLWYTPGGLKIIKRKPLEELPSEFKQLWDRIKYKTRYQVEIDTEKLIESVVNDLGKTLQVDYNMVRNAEVIR